MTEDAIQHAVQQPIPAVTRLVAGMRQAITAFAPLAVAQCEGFKRIAVSVRVEVTEDTPER